MQIDDVLSFHGISWSKRVGFGVDNTNVNLGSRNSITVFPRINAAAFIKFFMIWVRRLFEGGVYSRAAFI